MIIESGSINLSGHMANGLCPCCNSGLDRIKRNLIEISRLVAKPLPETVAGRLGSLLADVRECGRQMLAELNQSLSCGKLPCFPVEFENSVSRFGRGIDKLTLEGGARGIAEDGVYHIYALRFALAQLATNVREVVEELNVRPPDRIKAETNGPPEHVPAAH